MSRRCSPGLKRSDAAVLLLLFVSQWIAVPQLLAPWAVRAAAAQEASVESVQQAEQANKELEELRGKIEREEGRLATLRARESKIQQELSKLEGELSVIRTDKERLQTSVAELQQNEAERKSETDAARAKTEELLSGFKRRLVAMYKLRRRSSSLDYLFSATSATDLLKRAYYLGEIAEHDQAALARLADQLKTLESARRGLEESSRRTQLELEKLSAAETELEKKRVEQAALLREEREKREQITRSLRQLTESAKNLETVLASLTGDREPPKLVIAPEPPTAPSTPEAAPEPVRVVSSRAAAVRSEGIQPSDAGFDGPGLVALKGKLPFPVEGRLVQRFGRQRHLEFSDMLFVKGLEVSAPQGSQVRAVAPGRVVLSKTLPGYGRVVIVDHGKRYYTLYARLASALASAGAIVQAGEVIATLGQPDRRGRNFYFELRIKGKASNPGEFFAKLPPTEPG